MTVLLLTMLAVLSMQAQREVYHSSVPEFTLTVPEGGGDGRCVVLVPGGGYSHIAGSHEGKSWIPFFTSQGISVVVTKYTLPVLYERRQSRCHDVERARYGRLFHAAGNVRVD